MLVTVLNGLTPTYQNSFALTSNSERQSLLPFKEEDPGKQMGKVTFTGHTDVKWWSQVMTIGSPRFFSFFSFPKAMR